MTVIEECYINKYGEPERKAEFTSPDGNKVEIYKWSEKQTGEGVAMYATMGASDVLGSGDTGCEFFIGLEPAVDDIVQALAEVALHGNGTQDVPSNGDTITLAYPLWSGTEVRSFMFTDGDEIVSPLQAGSKKIKFVQLVPLFDAELLFKKEKGEAALWDRFIEQSVPYWDSGREDSVL